MADPTALPYQEAATGIDEQKRRQLAAMASGGVAAKATITDAEARITAAKQQAIDAALAESRQFNAPADVQQNVSGKIAMPYDTRVSSLEQGQANRAADESYRAGATTDFFNRLTQGIPLAQIRAKSLYDQAVQRVEAARQAAAAKQQLEIQLANMKAAADDARQKRADDLAERRFQQQYDLSERKFGQSSSLAERRFEQQMKLQAARDARSGRSGSGSGSGKGTTDKSYLGLGLGNAGESKVQLEALVNQLGGKFAAGKASQQAAAKSPTGFTKGITFGAKLGANIPGAKANAAGALDTQFGLPSGTIRASLPEGAFKIGAPTPPPKPVAPTNEAIYGGIKQIAIDLKSGAYDGHKYTTKELIDFIRSNVTGGASSTADKALRDLGIIS